MAIIGIIGSKVLRMSENFFPLLYVLTDYACIIIHGICSMLLYLPFHSSLDSPCTRCGHMVCMCSRRTLQFSWFISERGPAKDSFDAMTHPTVFVSNQGIMIGWYEQSLCLQSKGEEKKKKILCATWLLIREWRNKTRAPRRLSGGCEMRALCCVSLWIATVFPWSFTESVCRCLPLSPTYAWVDVFLHAYLLLSFSIFLEKCWLHELINSLFLHELHFLCHHFKLLWFFSWFSFVSQWIGKLRWSQPYQTSYCRYW